MKKCTEFVLRIVINDVSGSAFLNRKNKVNVKAKKTP